MAAEDYNTKIKKILFNKLNIFNIYNYMYILRHNVNYLNYLCMNEQLKKSPFWPGGETSMMIVKSAEGVSEWMHIRRTQRTAIIVP
jgi:hypothetical protein